MLENTHHRDDLVGLARKKRRPVVTEAVAPGELEDRLAAGWSLVRRNKRSLLLAKEKRSDVAFEDRVWSLFYRLGFTVLSGERGTRLILNPGHSNEVGNQLDIFAMDTEVIVAVECKSSAAPKRRGDFQSELAKLTGMREGIARSVRAQYPGTKRSLALVFFLRNAILSDNDRTRAEQQNVVVFEEQDLEYYENLVGHLGHAARYQLLADIIPGKPIPGLEISVPAIRSKMAGVNCYIFSIRPEYLLKIAYVSHRSKGRASDVDAYQRMISKARLGRIAQYISAGGVFPTNIVINLDTSRRGMRVDFQRSKQEQENEWAALGWLTLRPTYKCAWLIDGQHRLFAYSGHPSADKALVSVMAFEGLPGSEQMRLFSDINAKQKSVKQSLLQELYADLHMFSGDPSKRIQAVISRAVQGLGTERDSPLYGRILLADSPRTSSRCISLTSVFSALDKSGFYYGQVKGNVIVDPGPLWHDDNETAIRRTIAILKGWLSYVQESVPEWWEAGSADGGGIAMNNGVTICLNVLRSVLEYFAQRGSKLSNGKPDEVVQRLAPFGEALASYFKGFSSEQREEFRALQGVAGQTAGTRHAQAFVRCRIPDFDPAGLQAFLDQEKAQTNGQAAAIILDIEQLLHRHVLDGVKALYPESGDDWWYEGVPESVRTFVAQRVESDKGKAGSREHYLDLIHYREIIQANWQALGTLFGYERVGNKNQRTQWIVKVNDIRKIAMHGSRGTTVSYEQLDALGGYLAWLQRQVMLDQPLSGPLESGDDFGA